MRCLAAKPKSRPSTLVSLQRLQYQLGEAGNTRTAAAMAPRRAAATRSHRALPPSKASQTVAKAPSHLATHAQGVAAVKRGGEDGDAECG